MLPITKETIDAAVARFADSGRAASEAAHRAWSREHPSVPCERCFGRGTYAQHPDGSRTPFDHERFCTKVDTFVASCEECCGLGRVFVSSDEKAARDAAELRAQRARFARVRDAVCAERVMTRAAFDALARRRIVGAPAPVKWIEAALEVARDFGIEVPR